jgi:hypothetical protein
MLHRSVTKSPRRPRLGIIFAALVEKRRNRRRLSESGRSGLTDSYAALSRTLGNGKQMKDSAGRPASAAGALEPLRHPGGMARCGSRGQ